ncbi:unnamed protein product [Lampetra fluviatilis]
MASAMLMWTSHSWLMATEVKASRLSKKEQCVVTPGRPCLKEKSRGINEALQDKLTNPLNHRHRFVKAVNVGGGGGLANAKRPLGLPLPLFAPLDIRGRAGSPGRTSGAE